MQKAVGTVSLIERFLTRNKGFVTIYAGKNDVCLEIMQEKCKFATNFIPGAVVWKEIPALTPYLYIYTIKYEKLLFPTSPEGLCPFGNYAGSDDACRHDDEL